MRTVVLLIAALLPACKTGSGVLVVKDDSGTAGDTDVGTPIDTDTSTTPDGLCPKGVEPTDTTPAFCGEVPSNLIFISIDTLRRDHLDRYGDKQLMPFLDSLATEGFPLDANTQCSNWTYASTTCTLMGRYNVDAGFIPSLNMSEPVPEGTPFLAGWLGEHGIWSVLVSGNGWLGGQWGNGEGYDVIRKPGGSGLLQGREKAIAELRVAQAEGVADNWFVHLHALEPHIPYVPPPDLIVGLEDLPPLPEEIDLDSQAGHYRATGGWPAMTEEERDVLEAHLRVRYEGEARLVDARLADTLQDFEAEGLLEDALVVVWTDHGEAFWEHDWQSHAFGLYGEENDALAIFWSKNMIPGSWSEPTVSIDIVPTVLRLFDIPIPSEVTGYPVGEAPADRARFSMVSARLGQASAVMQDGWRLQFYWGSGILSLTRPGEDPLEQTEYQPRDSKEYHDKVRELWPLLEPRIEQALEALPNSNISWPEGLR